MLISQTTTATTSSVRLRLPAFPQGFGASIEGRPMTAGTSAPTYGVRVPAFVKGDAAVAVRAWRPPV